MLTKSDLSQIRKVVREEVKTEVKDSTRTLDGQIRISRMQIQNEINELDDRMKNVEIRVDSVGNDVKDVKSNLRKANKTLSLVVKNYDEGDVKLARRVKRIEEHLRITDQPV